MPQTLCEQVSHLTLEQGRVLYFPELPFTLEDHEHRFLSPDLALGNRKNVSFDPRTGVLRGVQKAALDSALQLMMRRFANFAYTLVTSTLPRYGDVAEWGLASFRPAEVAGRQTSRRKDDTRLHVDAFPSRPTQGRRILRVFTNVGWQPRRWQLGESFEKVVDNFAPSLRLPLPGSAWLLRRLRIVKGRRSPYDHLMLQLHDLMKADVQYQARAVSEQVLFPPGATWMVFTDQVSHAALAGQFALEQTFFIPAYALEDQASAPLRVLEKRFHRILSS